MLWRQISRFRIWSRGSSESPLLRFPWWKRRQPGRVSPACRPAGARRLRTFYCGRVLAAMGARRLRRKPLPGRTRRAGASTSAKCAKRAGTSIRHPHCQSATRRATFAHVAPMAPFAGQFATGAHGPRHKAKVAVGKRAERSHMSGPVFRQLPGRRIPNVRGSCLSRGNGRNLQTNRKEKHS